MASPLAANWIYATVPIDNPEGGSGTGFLVSRKIDENQFKVFLVTNKHVVCQDPALRPNVPHITAHFNTIEGDGSHGTASGQVPLVRPDGSKTFREHPDPDTDVYAIDVTSVIKLNPKFQAKWVGYDLFGDEPKRTELDITAGEDVVTIGYPLGLREGDSNFPLIRQGMIATKIGTPLKDKVQTPEGVLRDRTLRAFLIDGATVPGSSGSPVILKPVSGRLQGQSIKLGLPPPVLLGIVAEAFYAPIQVGSSDTQGFAGLGLVFQVETIRETIELFFA